MAMGKLARLVDGNTAQPADVAGANPRPVDLDPRPDLEEDHRDWVAVLAAAWQDSELHGLLHGLRCGGARLERRQGARGAYYRIDYSPLLPYWDEDVLRRDWLEPMRGRIKAVLDAGLRLRHEVERELAS